MSLKKYLAGLTLGFALTPLTAQAVTDHPATDATSFQLALNASVTDGDDSRVVLAAGEYHTGDNFAQSEFIYFAIDGTSLEIQGAGAGETILSGDNATRVLDIQDISLLPLDGSIDHVTVSGVSIVDGLIQSDEPSFGGGLLIQSISGINQVNIHESHFRNNRIQNLEAEFNGAGGGAAVPTFFNQLALTNNSFEQNSAGIGGGIVVGPFRLPEDDEAPVILSPGFIDLQGNQFVGNQAETGGGATLLSATASLERNNFEGNTAQDLAGGLLLISIEEANLNSNRFVGNHALGSDGGGLFIVAAPKVSVTNSIILNNTAGLFGGGLQYGSSDTGDDSAVIKKWLLDYAPSKQNGIDDLVNADIAAGPGLTLTHNTISGNSANISGGGVAIFLQPEFGEGGLEGMSPDPVDLYNNIVYGNNTNDGPGADIYVSDFASELQDDVPAFFAATINLFNNDYSDFFSECQDDAGCVGENNVNEDPTNINEDPLLTDLANADTHLRGGSPAIDKGDLDPPGYKTLDYDGVTRFYGTGPDMGALETTPAIEVTPLEYNFGNVEVGESKSTVITIKSIGAAILDVSSISLEDTNNFAFDVNGGSNPCGSTSPSLPSGESCTVGATFAPDVEGALDTFLTVDSNAVNDPSVPVHLLGNGVEDGGFLEGSGIHSLFGCSLSAAAPGNFSGLLWMLSGLPLVVVLRQRRR